jgi:mannose-6-phosphate isomerase-like protein (cupin superfamily)
MVRKINLAETLGLFDEHWSPKIIGEVNECQVKLVKFSGEFVWHAHEHEDELFLVLKGRLRMRLRDGELTLDPGELVIIQEEVDVLLFEPRTTLNTGNVQNERTRVELERI